MFNLIATSLQDRLLRIAVLCVFLTGFAHSAISPFLSIIAIERLGFSTFDYALMQVFSAILSVGSSIAIGIFTDQTGRYQDVLITSILAGIATGAIMYFLPSQLSFIIMLTVLAPIAATGFSQYFALAHLAASSNKKLNKDFSTSFVRAAYSSSYVITPTIVATIFASGADIWVIFGVSAIVSIIVLAVVVTSWPKDATPERTTTSGIAFLSGLRELATFSIFIPVMLVAILLGVNLLYFNLLGLLVLNNFGGVEADIALFSGGVALVEIPIMLSGAIILRYISKSSLLLISSIVYAGFLWGLGSATSMDQVWWLMLPAGLSAGFILTVTLGFVQDLKPNNPGLGGSLVSVAHFTSKLWMAAIFATGTMISDYAGTAWLGAGVGLLAAVILFLITKDQATSQQATSEN